MDKTKAWYKELRKPFFAPPSWIFGPAWTLLYLLIAISFGFVAYKTYQGIVPAFVFAPFVINLIANAAYSPIQFRLRNLLLASLDILIVLGSLIVAIVLIYPYFTWVSWINIPYLLWVSFATILQLTITFMNKDKWHA